MNGAIVVQARGAALSPQTVVKDGLVLCGRGSAGMTAHLQHCPCREKLVFGALNRMIEADESGQDWKQSHQRPD